MEKVTYVLSSRAISYDLERRPRSFTYTARLFKRDLSYRSAAVNKEVSTGMTRRAVPPR